MTFRDVPEAITEGDTLEDALKYAAEALEPALKHHLDESSRPLSWTKYPISLD